MSFDLNLAIYRPTCTHLLSLAFILAVILPLCPIHAQQNELDTDKHISEYNFELWTSENGLPTNGATQIIQTKDGYIWLATYGGLVRFDGVSLQEQVIEGFNGRSFSTLYEDGDTLWVGSHSGGIAKLHDNKWKIYSTGKGIPSIIVEFLFRDSAGVLWVGTAGGLTYMDGNEFTQKNVPPHLKNITVHDILEDSLNNLWITTHGTGVFQYNSRNKACKLIHSLNGQIGTDMIKDADGNIWVTTDQGVWVFKTDGSHQIFTEADGIAHHNVFEVYPDSKGNVWLGTEIGLSRYSKGRFSSFTHSDQLDNHNVTGIVEDFEGNLWVTTYRSGMYSLKNSKFTNYNETHGLLEKLTTGVFEDADGTILVSSHNRISAFENGRFTEVLENRKIHGEMVREVFRDSKGTTWVATTNGLEMILPNGASRIFTEKNGITNNFVRVILEAKDGSLWFGTRRGLNKFNNGKFENFTINDGFENDHILSLFEDSQKNIWAGTRGALIKYKDNAFTNYTIKDGLAGHVIFRIYEDKDGVIWIGSNSGLTRLKNDTFFSYNNQETGFDINVFQVIEDDNEKFWITSSNGVYAVNKKELNDIADGKEDEVQLVLYDVRDGMRNESCIPSAKAIKDRNGKIWVPTNVGISVIDPDYQQKNTIKPPVMIEGLTVDNQVKNVSRDIILGPEANRLEFTFAALSFTNPSKTQIQYKLEGFDNQWQISSGDRKAIYTNLPPGDFSFKVIAANDAGVWNRVGADISIMKRPYFHETIYFYILLILSIAGVFFLIFLWKTRSIKKRNTQLESIVREKTYELKTQNKSLIELNEEKNNLVRTVSHDMKSPVSSILGLSNLLLSATNLKVEQLDYLDKIKLISQNMLKMVDRFLNLEEIEAGEKNLNLTKINVSEDLADVLEVSASIASKKNIEIVFTNGISPAHIEVDVDYFNKAVENLLSNAIKFSPGHKKVHVELLRTTDNKIRLSVKDEGPGITSSDKPKLFRKFQKLSARPTAGESSSGLGLSIVKKYTEAMGGTVRYEDNEKGGASFILEYDEASS